MTKKQAGIIIISFSFILFAVFLWGINQKPVIPKLTNSNMQQARLKSQMFREEGNESVGIKLLSALEKRNEIKNRRTNGQSRLSP